MATEVCADGPLVPGDVIPVQACLPCGRLGRRGNVPASLYGDATAPRSGCRHFVEENVRPPVCQVGDGLDTLVECEATLEMRVAEVAGSEPCLPCAPLFIVDA